MRAIETPIAIDQKIRDLIQGIGGRGWQRGARYFTNRKAITTGAPIILGANIKIVTAGGHCGEVYKRIVSWPAIIIQC
jgi:hypothetical protein